MPIVTALRNHLEAGSARAVWICHVFSPKMRVTSDRWPAFKYLSFVSCNHQRITVRGVHKSFTYAERSRSQFLFAMAVEKRLRLNTILGVGRGVLSGRGGLMLCNVTALL
jgi:hypothetical protein